MEIASVPYSNVFNDSKILKPNYHLNYGKRRIENALKKEKSFTTLGDAVKDVYTGGIFKRVFVEKKEFGLPYISAQHMMNTHPLEIAKIISKRYTPRQEDMTLRTNQILISCAGTVGNARLIGEDLDGIIGSQDIIRVISNDAKYPYGFIYAYLASPTAYNYIQSFIYGSVVPRIEPKTLAKLPIPIFNKSKQQEIHNLIIEASSLRVVSSKLLKEAIGFFDALNINYKYGTSVYNAVSIKHINSRYKRFDSSHAIVSELLSGSFRNSNINFVTIKSQASRIFIGPRMKRNYVNNGVPFLSTSAMQKANPTKTDKFITTKSAIGFIVSEGWILTTRSGTLGDTIYTLPCITGYAVSEDAIRIVLKKNTQITNKYLFAFLKSAIGKSSLLLGSYGSVIEHLNEDYIGDIKVPLLEDSHIITIEQKIDDYVNNINKAIVKENLAIELVEKEIESWQE